MSDLLSQLQQALAGRYRVERELGRGGMAIVYLAHDLKHHRRVAIKVLKPELVPALGPDRFLREIEIAARLAHPNILPLYDSGEAGGLLYYVMPYVEGETLRQRLDRETHLPVDLAVQIATEVAEALGYAHALGFIHRDIKPENILFQAGHATVSDFGIARAVSEATEGGAGHLTESGITVGTVAYMSPEQAVGRKDLDGRADIYSLGCVLHEMLTGGDPLAGAEGREAGQALPAPVTTVIAKALARAPADRFTTAAQFREALLAAAAGFHAARRRKRGVLLTAVASVVAVGAAVYFGGLGDRIVGATGGAGPSIRLAVLPLENLTGDPAQDYFSDGLTAEMITQLGRLQPQRLGVIARTSAMRYKNTDKPIDEIGRELGADYILEGNARRDGGRVRITVQLIRVRDQTQLWAEGFERELSGVLQVQSDVARGVALSLSVALLPGEQTRLAESRLVSPEAYEAYLKGRFHYQRFTPPDLDLALRYYEASLAKDARHAPAYAGIAGVWVGRNMMGFARPDEATPKARVAALKALELDSTLALAHYALGSVAWAEWQWEINEREWRRAIELDPSMPDARAGYSHLLIALGRPKEALAQAERAVRLDPFNAFMHASYGVILYFVGRYDEAIEELQNVQRTSPGPLAQCALWHAFNIAGRREQALGGAEGCLGHYSPAVKRALDEGFAKGGYAGAMRRVADLLAGGVGGVYVAPIDVYIPYLHAGEHDRALEWLAKAVEVRDLNVYGAFADPFAKRRLGDDPRFQALVRRARLPG